MFFTYMFVFVSSIVYAHPPQEISLNYDLKTKTLEVQASHNSGGDDDHYIRKVVIRKGDDSPIIVYSNKEQVSPNSFTTNIGLEIETKAGDILSVELYCSKGGKKLETYVIQDKLVIKDAKKENIIEGTPNVDSTIIKEDEEDLKTMGIDEEEYESWDFYEEDY